jgi:GH35 family endo-1,4-beta-xylanase
VSYAGREETANWRLLAAERIDKIRKAFLTVRVVDANGKPVPKAAVSVRMKRHSFGWGSAVDAKTLFGEGPEHDRYRAHILENFNRVVLENDLKWHSWSQDPQLGMRAITWLRERGLAVRGHCLVWPGKENLPPWIHPLLGHPEALREALLARVRETAGVLRGQLVEWDVINEPFSNFDVQTALSGVALAKGGDAVEQHAETLAQFFHAARKVDPEVKLDINDYSILETGGTDAAHQDHYERTIRRLLEKQTPLGGIGIQGHFNEQLTPVPRLWEILDRFAKFGLPIQITELDVNTYDEALQADYTRDFLTAMFAHESVSGVLTWGFWEKRHWIPNAAFYRADWSPRPAAQVWQDLVRKKWWTSADLTTDAKGEADIRGFLGDYDVTVEHEGKKADGTVILLRSGATVELVLKN